MKSKLLEQIVVSLTSILITSIIGVIITVAIVDKGKVIIGDTIQSGRLYYLSVNFVNYSSNSLKGITINVPGNIGNNDILVNMPVGINVSDKNISQNDWSKVTIDSIPSNSKLSMVIISTKNFK